MFPAENLVTFTFYVAAGVTLLSTVLMISRTNAVHALLYLVVSSLSLAIIFYLFGAPLAAALEIIIYAGAIMILFVFVVMMLNLGKGGQAQEQNWLSPGIWWFPSTLAAVLLFMLLQMFSHEQTAAVLHLVSAKQVGIALFGPYVLAVELASFLLLAGLVGAFHLARTTQKSREVMPPFEQVKKRKKTKTMAEGAEL